MERKFEETPILKNMLVGGKVSFNKLAKVASIATPENQEILANQIKLLSCRALETLSRDVHVNTDPSQNPQNTSGSGGGIGIEVTQKLLELQQKGIDINKLLLEFLEQRELRIAQDKERLSTETTSTNSRCIPFATRKLLKEEYGKKCSIKTCARPAKQIHHSQRFSLAKIHDPKFLAPLCREHHAIAHTVDLQFREFRAHAGP